jgi:hypothetical protein
MASQLSRRSFLASAAFSTVVPRRLAAAKELHCDIAVIGGGTGGCAAALAAARNGARVIMTEETDWIGGQLTSQAVPPDEHRWIEEFGLTGSYRAYRNAVREYYRKHLPLTAEARSRAQLNPGDGTVSRLTHEPRVSKAVLEAMLQPYVEKGILVILPKHRPVRAEARNDLVRAVTVRDATTGRDKTISARFFLDATEQGDLLPLSGAEYVTGFESRRQTNEPDAPENAEPANIQAFTCCFVMEHMPGEDHTIDKPAEYAFWRDYVPALTPPWPGKLLSWNTTHPITLQPRTHPFDPECDTRGTDGGLWTYRRIARRKNFERGYGSDICLVNWPQNDYWLGNLHEVSGDEFARHLARARQLSLSLFYWMQTEAPRADGGQGWRGLRLRPDVTGTSDGIAKYPYIRESRRILAEFTVLEQHVGTDARALFTGKPASEVTAEVFGDSVGVGSYRIDLHPSSGGNNYIDVDSLPFQIPLGALIPRRVENLIPAAKNLGVTHITNGCYRLHPVEWNIGESAALLAVESLRLKTMPRAVRNNAKLLSDFQVRIQAQGVQIAWPPRSA